MIKTFKWNSNVKDGWFTIGGDFKVSDTSMGWEGPRPAITKGDYFKLIDKTIKYKKKVTIDNGTWNGAEGWAYRYKYLIQIAGAANCEIVDDNEWAHLIRHSICVEDLNFEERKDMTYEILLDLKDKEKSRIIETTIDKKHELWEVDGHADLYSVEWEVDGHADRYRVLPGESVDRSTQLNYIGRISRERWQDMQDMQDEYKARVSK